MPHGAFAALVRVLDTHEVVARFCEGMSRDCITILGEGFGIAISGTEIL